uniref:Protein kinase domain-containing protein n=1 Tax=Chenopodium quinoa TaxID=63459 RepID=A0A803LL27_CHEQI
MSMLHVNNITDLPHPMQPGFTQTNKVTSKEIIIEDSGSTGESEYQDLPLLKFEMLVLATNNFKITNKLGQGGFGPVYKGTIENGKEIAVKRLARASGQGQREFMNEVIVISKLQHKNLVRLLGCCVEGDEKLLVYEFMPNKSLDAFLFDPVQRELLDWKTRYGIIKGICRGVLYLHRDSRLKIIHRDLKASNIFLDEELNPKISDFGMARIFGGKQDQADTLRVVGTYGYMSPEYAMDGRFSEKSDVFSLGVLLLEIVSGRRNGSIRDDSMSLISYAWKLWNEDEIHSLIDPTISGPCYEVEIVKSIHVGLLCAQEYPENRPSISSVISMLDCEVIDLPRPLQPGFTQWRTCLATEDAKQQHCSDNLVSISSVQGR